jgi:hypothetical protein
MKQRVQIKTATVWIWGSFAAGFIFPPAFALFLPLACVAAWRAFKEEYEEVGAEIKERAVSGAQRCVRLWSTAEEASMPLPFVTMPRPEMV